MTDQNDPLDGLEERLRNNSKAFESILALTPAQEHFGTAIVDGRDPSEQWRAKKQTKAEKKAARKAKLDPANQKSALDVMKERERKRKRELGMEVDGGEDVEQDQTIPTQLPNTNKRARTEQASEIDQAKREASAEKRKQKRERKKQKEEKIRTKREAKKAKAQDGVGAMAADDDDDDDDNADSDTNEEVANVELDGLLDADIQNITDDKDEASTAPSSPVVDSPAAFDISANHSTTSSSSSILPPTGTKDTKISSKKSTTQTLPQGQTLTRPPLSITLPEPPTAASLLQNAELSSRTSSPKPHLPKIDPAILQERLRTRLAELRAKRKADGEEGQPARSRQELLEQRRKKAEQRKAHKKELRRKAKEEEARKQEERLRGSGSPLSGADIFSPRSEANSFSFSRLAFADGTATDASLSKLVDAPRQKGPQDAKTALMAAENKQKRLAGLDEGKRADIGEKDLWLNASKRAHGERVRDDTSLLKKALKRKEKQKNKSEKEWQDRSEAVVKGKEMKQKRREDNLAKRRDEKGSSKKKPLKKGGKKSRPGFEGRFKA